MSDVADILGLNQSSSSSSNNIIDEATKILYDKPKGMNSGPKAVKKPKGMSREVFGLIGADGILPAMQGNKPSNAGFKSKRLNATKGKWLWVPFSNSARGDNQTFLHWVKADVQYNDYPYAKFNVSVEPITFTDEEYNSLLVSKSWNKEETLHVIDLASKYSLRWPVVTDRYEFEPPKSQEDIQARYFTVVSRLREHRLGISNGAADFAREDHQLVYNLEYEKRRKYQLEMAYRKTREEEFEEQQLREELKCIDILLKKAKRTIKLPSAGASLSAPMYSFLPKDPFASTSSQSGVAETASSQLNYSSASSLPPDTTPSAAVVHTSEGDAKDSIPDVTVVHPSPGRPCLQSARLIVTERALGLPRLVTKKLNVLLHDLGAPEYPLPTKTVCDMYDQIRQEGLTLIALQSTIAKKEKELATCRSIQKAVTGFDSFHRDITLPQSALLYKLPSEPVQETKALTPMIPSSPQRPMATSPHDYGDLVASLGVALLTVDMNPTTDLEGATTSNTKKATKRKSSGTGNSGSTTSAEGAIAGGEGENPPTKKPAPKRSRAKPKESTGGMDPAAIADAAARAMNATISNSITIDSSASASSATSSLTIPEQNLQSISSSVGSHGAPHPNYIKMEPTAYSTQMATAAPGQTSHGLDYGTRPNFPMMTPQYHNQQLMQPTGSGMYLPLPPDRSATAIRYTLQQHHPQASQQQPPH